MKVLFDTSVLIAALSARHIENARALPWLERALAGEVSGVVSTHALAELYGTLTGHAAWRIPPQLCIQVLQSNISRFDVTGIDESDYWYTLEQMARLGLPGGGIYAALHARAAHKSGAEAILTLNAKHFSRLGDDTARLVRVP
ncbi:MAG: type II toxin-antitoxin system VapC family toxin [Trueperaceae bacterium]